MTTPDPTARLESGVQLVECVCCGRVGLPERIHGLSCPHDV